MISDNDLYTLSIFLGSCAMLLIVLYHFLEVNAQDDTDDATAAESGNAELNKELTDEKSGVGAVKPQRSGTGVGAGVKS